MSELIRKTAAELGRLVASGEVSTVEVTQAHLDRIAEVEQKIDAFLHVAAEAALEQARAVDERRAKGERLGMARRLDPLAYGVLTALADAYGATASAS